MDGNIRPATPEQDQPRHAASLNVVQWKWPEALTLPLAADAIFLIDRQRIALRKQPALGLRQVQADRSGLVALPHLFNVLNGSMSLVGPQPLSERQIEHTPVAERDTYFACRPGLTGLWELEGRRGVRNGPRLDMRYATEFSPQLDLKIIAKTLANITKD